jgi:hypothetical protein
LTGRRLYHSNVAIGGEYINFLGNEVFGTASIGGHRVEIIGNTFHGGATVVIHNRVTDSLLDCNRFLDSPGRICFYPRRHCYLRYNEVHQAFRGTWANADEIYLAHGGASQTTGSPTATTPSTITDDKQQWEPGELQDAVVLITHGRGFGQYRRVIDNTEDTMVLESPLRVVPNADSEFSVGMKYLESVFFANLNNTPSRLSLWLDCVGCVVEDHRDVFAGGLDVWGQDRSDTQAAREEQQRNRFHPSYYNLFRNCWLDGSHALLWSNLTPSRAYRGVPLFGNYICDNRLRASHVRRTGFASFRAARGAIQIGNPSDDVTQPQSRQVALSHTVVSGNYIACNDVGILVSDYARKTFLVGNEFQEVDRAILDWGSETISRRNGSRVVDERGKIARSLSDSRGSGSGTNAVIKE